MDETSTIDLLTEIRDLLLEGSHDVREPARQTHVLAVLIEQLTEAVDQATAKFAAANVAFAQRLDKLDESGLDLVAPSASFDPIIADHGAPLSSVCESNEGTARQAPSPSAAPYSTTTQGGVA